MSIIELTRKSTVYSGFETGAGFIAGYPSLFTQLSSSATGIAGSAEAALEKLNLLMGEKNIASLSDTVEQVNRLASNLALASEGMGELIANINRVSIELETTLPAYRAVGIKLEQELVPAVLQTAAELQAATASTSLPHVSGDAVAQAMSSSYSEAFDQLCRALDPVPGL